MGPPSRRPRALIEISGMYGLYVRSLSIGGLSRSGKSFSQRQRRLTPESHVDERAFLEKRGIDLHVDWNSCLILTGGQIFRVSVDLKQGKSPLDIDVGGPPASGHRKIEDYSSNSNQIVIN